MNKMTQTDRIEQRQRRILALLELIVADDALKSGDLPCDPDDPDCEPTDPGNGDPPPGP